VLFIPYSYLQAAGKPVPFILEPATLLAISCLVGLVGSYRAYRKLWGEFPDSPDYSRIVDQLGSLLAEGQALMSNTLTDSIELLHWSTLVGAWRKKVAIAITQSNLPSPGALVRTLDTSSGGSYHWGSQLNDAHGKLLNKLKVWTTNLSGIIQRYSTTA
jgi:hypothetical protein